MPRPLAIAHRGDPYAFRENTLEALAAAEAAGADMVELDLRRTGDGAIAVVHDRTLERIWGLPRAVAELTLDQVRLCGDGDCRIPSLPDVLAASAGELMLDFVDEDVVEPALDAVAAADALERMLFAGGNVAGHRRLRALAPAARIALTWTASEPPPEALLDELQVEYLNPEWPLVSAELVARMHARGTAVSTWTVDDPAQMGRLLDLGVDAVITNRIAALAALLAEREALGDAAC